MTDETSDGKNAVGPEETTAGDDQEEIAAFRSLVTSYVTQHFNVQPTSAQLDLATLWFRQALRRSDMPSRGAAAYGRVAEILGGVAVYGHYTGYKPLPSGPIVTQKNLRIVGAFNKKAIVSALISNPSPSRFEGVEYELITAAQPLRIAGFGFRAIGTPTSGHVFVPTHLNAFEVPRRIEQVRDLEPGETRPVRFEVQVPTASKYVVQLVTRRVQQGGDWAAAEPVVLVEAVIDYVNHSPADPSSVGDSSAQPAVRSAPPPVKQAWLAGTLSHQLKGAAVLDIVEGTNEAIVATDAGIFLIKKKGATARMYHWNEIRGVEFVARKGFVVLHLADAKAPPKSMYDATRDEAALVVGPFAATQKAAAVERLARLIAGRAPAPPVDRRREEELANITSGWTAASVVRTYPTDNSGASGYQADAGILSNHGYAATVAWEQAGRVKTSNLILWGAPGAAIGDARGKGGVRQIGTRTVTFAKVAAATVEAAADQPKPNPPDPIEQIERLGKLRDSGLITSEEFEAKKAELLARM